MIRRLAAQGLAFAFLGLAAAGCASLSSEADAPEIQIAAGSAFVPSFAPRQSRPALESAIPPALAAAAPLRPRIVRGVRPYQCVPYARAVSGVGIRGDAVTWWRQAEGRYLRGRLPAAGAVLVTEGYRNTRRGHVAVVTRVLGPRKIVVTHANWLNDQRIHIDEPVMDVSPNNDWSQVRVWYTPGQRWGARTYKVRGFIYPDGVTPPAGRLHLATRGPRRAT